MRKTTHEIIDEVVDFYSKNPRSKTEDQCLYRGPNGTECAFARMVKDEFKNRLPELSSADGVLALLGFDILKEEYAGYTSPFYMSIQFLHDGDKNWNDGGLSAIGEDLVARLKKEYPVIPLTQCAK